MHPMNFTLKYTVVFIWLLVDSLAGNRNFSCLNFFFLCIIIIFEFLKILLVTSLKYKFSLGRDEFFYIKIFIHDNFGRDLLLFNKNFPI